MTYSTEIGKKQATAFAELYKFTIGTDIYYYTSHEQEVTFENKIYSPRPIKRGNYESDDKLQPQRIQITLPLTEFVLAYVANSPVKTVYVTIKRVILDEIMDSYLFFQGEVVNITIEGSTGVLDCEAGTEIFRNQFPSQVYQARCQWSLFDGGCGLSELNFETQATVSVDGATLTSPTFATKTDGYFTMGFCEFKDDLRLITNHAGNQVTLQVPFDAGLQSGMVVRAYPGDDKSYSTCKNKFNNIAKWTGFKYIPSSNPVIWGFK